MNPFTSSSIKTALNEVRRAFFPASAKKEVSLATVFPKSTALFADVTSGALSFTMPEDFYRQVLPVFVTGNSSVNNITITVPSGYTINGSSSYVVTTNENVFYVIGPFNNNFEVMLGSVIELNLENGTEDFQTAYWDDTNQVWKPNSLLKVDPAGQLLIQFADGSVVNLTDSNFSILKDNTGVISIENSGDGNILIQTSGGGNIQIISSGTGEIQTQGNLLLNTNNNTLLIEDTTIALPITTAVNATHAVAIGQYTVLLDSTVTTAVTLPNPATVEIGSIFVLKKTDTTGDIVTVTPAAGLIDGEADYSWTSVKSSITVQTNGTNWFIL